LRTEIQKADDVEWASKVSRDTYIKGLLMQNAGIDPADIETLTAAFSNLTQTLALSNSNNSGRNATMAAITDFIAKKLSRPSPAGTVDK
jgi:hypothetical protein